jgi:copper resistance protein B
VEIDFALQDVPEIGVGSGLSKAEVGLRLRYEIVKEFAPYIGVEYNETFGDTAAFERAVGGDVSHLSFVFGVRAWF